MEMIDVLGNGPDEIVLDVEELYMVLLVDLREVLQLIHAHLQIFQLWVMAYL